MPRSPETGWQAEVTPESPHFELERFSWAGPDKLQLVGRFLGLEHDPSDPVLDVRGPEGTQRLTAVAGSVSGGERWRAEFAWSEPPGPFECAELRFGDGLVVDLPAPPGRGRPSPRRALVIRRDGPGERPAPVDTSATERVRLQAELLVAREEAHDLREELAATRAALESERARRASDAERFREDMAIVGDSAEEAAAAQVTEVQALRSRVAELERDAAAGRARAAEETHLREAVEDARTRLADVLERLPATGGDGA